MKERVKEQITDVLRHHPEVRAAYLFGSLVSGNTGPLSDVDVAVYVPDLSGSKLLDLRLTLIGELTSALKTDNLDLVMINQSNNPALNYVIISEGELLLDKGTDRLIFEPGIMNTYFDHRMALEKNGLAGEAV